MSRSLGALILVPNQRQEQWKHTGDIRKSCHPPRRVWLLLMVAPVQARRFFGSTNKSSPDCSLPVACSSLCIKSDFSLLKLISVLIPHALPWLAYP